VGRRDSRPTPCGPRLARNFQHGRGRRPGLRQGRHRVPRPTGQAQFSRSGRVLKHAAERAREGGSGRATKERESEPGHGNERHGIREQRFGILGQDWRR